MIAVYDWFGYAVPIETRYRLIKEAGFDGVLMWWSGGFGRGDYRSGPELARKAGLMIENIHCPIQQEHDLWKDALDGETVLECYLRCIADCVRFQIPTMVVHLPGDDCPCTLLGLDRLQRIAEKAEHAGVNVALENLQNIRNLSLALDTVDSPRVGFCYDCCHHVNYCPETDLPARFGSRLMAVHLHDNGGSRAQHQLPFDGHICWPEMMNRISQTGYRGMIALEPMNWDYQNLSIEEFLRRAAQKARALQEL